MSLSNLFNDPLYLGGGLSSTVPYSLPVAINGREYLIDLRGYERAFLPAQRQSIDSEAEPGGQTLNPLGLWPRSGDDFQYGAGQKYRDDADVMPSRFWESKGINVWEPHSACLLPDTDKKRTSANTNLKLLTVAGRLILADGQEVLWTDDPEADSPTWTAFTGTPAAAVKSMTTDGYYLYVSYGASGIYRGSAAGTSLASFSAAASDYCFYSNGRLFSGNANVLNEVDSAGVVTAVHTHDNANFVWTHATSTPAATYIGGLNGDRSETYYMTVDPSTGSLSVPVVATSLPDGEYATSLFFYAGSIVIGTTRGVRAATSTQNDRGIAYGPLIETGSAVHAMGGYGEFVWFAWGNYDSDSTGLGRLNLSNFTGTLAPAYASDLMATAQGDVTGVAIFGGEQYFAVSGVGVYGPNFSSGEKVLVPSGTLDTGIINYGTSVAKIHAALRLSFDPLKGTIGTTMVDALGTEHTLPSQVTQDTYSNDSSGIVSRVSSTEVSLRFTLTRSTTDTTKGPCLRRWTLLALPVPDRTEVIKVPIILRDRVEHRGVTHHKMVVEEFEQMRFLAQTRKVVTYQEGSMTFTVYVDDVAMQPQEWADRYSWMEGTLMVTLVTVEY